MTYGPFFRVLGPRPRAPKHSLISQMNVNPPGDDHWLNGLATENYPPQGVTPNMPASYAPCNGGSSGGPKAAGPTFVAETDNDVFTVYDTITCTTRGMNADDLRQRLLAVFAASESWRVEKELEQGTVLAGTASPFLRKADTPAIGQGLTVMNAGGAAATATNLLNGLALLERAIADTGRAGVIHAPVEVVAGWSTLYAVFVEQDNMAGTKGKLVTVNGTLVVPGYGYQGAAPAGFNANAGTELFCYATHDVDIYRSESFLMPDPASIAAAVNRTINTVEFRAERYYAFNWGAQLRAGVRIDRCKTAC